MDENHLLAQRSSLTMAVIITAELDCSAPSGQLPNMKSGNVHMLWLKPAWPSLGPTSWCVRACLPSPVCIWRSYRMEERFSSPFGSFYHSCAAMVNTSVLFQASLSQPLPGFSDVWWSDMQDCDFLFVFSAKTDGLAFNTNSLTDFRTSPDD